MAGTPVSVIMIMAADRDQVLAALKRVIFVFILDIEGRISVKLVSYSLSSTAYAIPPSLSSISF